MYASTDEAFATILRVVAHLTEEAAVPVPTCVTRSSLVAAQISLRQLDDLKVWLRTLGPKDAEPQRLGGEWVAWTHIRGYSVCLIADDDTKIAAIEEFRARMNVTTPVVLDLVGAA